MIDEFLYKPLEDKTISKIQRFKINNKDLRELRLSFRNKTILISGAAGSIGSQFSKDIWNYKLKPKKIIFLDKDENLLAELNRNLLLLNNFKKIKTEFVCLDLTSMDLDDFLSTKKIQFYLNFAALKHVRSEESIESIKYMFKTNSISFIPKKNNNLEKIFSISTDKTVNPSSILGISKNLMEMNLERFSKRKIFSSSARFSNVAYSNGSILKYIADRIVQRKKFGIPSGVRRFFITHGEASNLCLKSLLKRNNKKIIIPSPIVLNQDYLISDLANKIIREFNFTPKFYKKGNIKKNYKNKICYVLLTPLSDGQKPYEELISDEEYIYEDADDDSICKVDLPGYDKGTSKLLNKIIKSKSINKLKIFLMKKFKNYNPPKKFINISKTI